MNNKAEFKRAIQIDNIDLVKLFQNPDPKAWLDVLEDDPLRVRHLPVEHQRHPEVFLAIYMSDPSREPVMLMNDKVVKEIFKELVIQGHPAVMAGIDMAAVVDGAAKHALKGKTIWKAAEYLDDHLRGVFRLEHEPPEEIAKYVHDKATATLFFDVRQRRRSKAPSEDFWRVPLEKELSFD